MKPASMARRTLLALLLLTPGAARAQEPAFDEGLFELVVQRVGTRVTLPALVDASGRVLVPLVPVLLEVGIPTTASGDVLVLEWPPDLWRTTIDTGARTLTIGTATDSLPARDWVSRNGVLHIATEALAKILQTQVHVDFVDLLIVVAENREFPAIRRMELEARRARAPGTLRRIVDDTTRYPARNGGAAVSWGVSLYDVAGVLRGSTRAAAGGSLRGGAAEAGVTLSFGDGQTTSFDDLHARWVRGFPSGTWVRQLQAGSVFGAGPAGRRMLGITVTNAPLTQPRYFDEALIEPAVPAGWEYEIYQGDHLVGVGNRESPGGVRTPIDYGNTPVRIRMVGPAGQEASQDLVYVVRPDMVPAGEWRHSAGLGACLDPGCDAYGYGEMRYGLSTRATAGAGIDLVSPEEQNAEWRPWLFLGGNPLPNASGEIQVQARGLVRGQLVFQGAGGSAINGSYTRLRLPADTSGFRVWNAQLGGVARVAAVGGRSVSTRLLVRGTRGHHIDLWQVSLSTPFRSFYSTLEFESGLQRRDLVTARTFAILPGLPVRDAGMSLSLGASSIGAELFESSATFRPFRDATASLGLRIRRGTRPTFTLGIVTRLPAAYAQTRATNGPGGHTIFFGAEGGLATGASNGTQLLPFESLGRAGISGFVFHDLDGDGVASQADAPAAGVTVLVGSHRVVTDETGAYRAWHVEPYESIAIAADSLSIGTGWMPAPVNRVVRPSPNLYTPVDLPLVRTRELSGSVRIDGEIRGAGGLTIQIRTPDGQLAAETRTFSDGEFYLPRLRPGTYNARIAASSLAALGATAAPDAIAFVVPAGIDDAPVVLPDFVLRRH